MSSDALVYRFSADTSQLKAGLNDVKGQLASIGAAARAQGQNVSSGFDSAGNALKKLEDLAKQVTLGMGALAAAATAALIGIGERAVAFGDQIKAAAGAFDQTVNTASEIKAVADRSGASLQSVGKAFVDLQYKARTGDETVTHALAAIGLSASSVAGLTQRELAVKLADTFSQVANSSNRTKAAVALFGEDVASKLVPQLDRGAASMLATMEAAHRAGAVIGPEMSAAISGTSEVFQKFKDRIAEIKMVFEGLLLQSFAKFKGAIDGIMTAFTDLLGNITTLIEWFKGLNGAGEGTAKSFGLLKTAADWFASAIVNAIAYLEDLSLRGVKYLDSLGVSFDGLSKIAIAFGQDVIGMASTSAAAFYAAYQAAIAGVMALFNDLAAAGKRALSFDLSGVKGALGQFGTDAATAGDKIKGALDPAQLLARTKAAYDEMRSAAGAQGQQIDAIRAKIEAQRQAQLALIAAGGAKAPAAGTRAAGDPTVPKKAADSADEAKTAVERYIDSLKKANATAQAEAQTWMLSNVERAKAVALAQAKAAAERDGLTLTEAQKKTVADLAAATQALRDKTEALKTAAQGLAETFADALDQLVLKGGKFNDVLKQVYMTLASAALKAALLGQGMFGGMTGGAAGTGGALGQLFNSLIAGFKADGGPVMGGKAYVVGERGPELFVPNGGGSIVPNGRRAPASAAQGDANPVVVNFHLPPGADAQSFRQSEGQITAMMGRAMARARRYA